MTQSKQIFWFLLVVCVLIRVGFWASYQPVTSNDTPTYEDLAVRLSRLDFRDYTGYRTPVYPLFMLLGGRNDSFIWLLQSILGVAISLLLYRLSLAYTKNINLALVIGLSYSLSLNQLFFEAVIRNETLSTLLLVLSLWLLMKIDRGQADQGRYYLALGLVTALIGLTRPLMLLLGPIYLVYLLWLGRAKKRSLLTASAYFNLSLFAIPFGLLVLLWCLFNQVTVDYFGPTTLTGYNLTQHSGSFMELAPERYGYLSQIYLRYREKQIATTGSHSMTIWRAIPEMRQATGLTYSQLSQTLTAMSIEMFTRHPGLYFRSVLEAWLKFWERPIYWVPDKIHPASVKLLLGPGWWLQDKLYGGVYLVFGFIVLGYLVALMRRQAIGSPFMIFLVAVILILSLVQALLEFGENGRYAIPFQPLIVYVVLTQVWAYRPLTSRSGRD